MKYNLKMKRFFIFLGILLALNSCVKDESVSVRTLTLDTEDITLVVGHTQQLVATVSPKNATNDLVIWSSKNSDIACVNKGLVTAISVGETEITAIADDNGIEAICKVTVVRDPDYPVPCDVEDIVVDPESVNMYLGEDTLISARLLPDNATNRNINWITVDSVIASVDSCGKVHANNVGTTHVLAISADGGFASKCQVNVFNHVSGVSLDKTYVPLRPGQSDTLMATVIPDDAMVKDVIWTSSNPDAVTVDSTGILSVKSVSSEDIVISVETADGGFISKCTVHTIQDVSGVKLNEYALTLSENDTVTLKATVLPEDADDKDVIWESSDENIVSVSQEGLVTAKYAGSAIITVVAQSDTTKKASCVITVTCPVSEVRMISESISSDKKATLKLNESMTVSANVLPDRAANDKVNWEISNPQIAEIYSSSSSTDMLIIAKKSGETVLKAISNENPAIYDSCVIVVSADPTGISLDTKSLQLFEGESATIRASLTPNDAVADIIWTSTPGSFVTVEDGKVTADKASPGPVIVRATVAGYDDLFAECTVTVKCHPSSIAFKNKEESLAPGETLKLSYTISPERTTEKDVEFSSDDEDVATVSSDGVVTALKEGTATITVKTVDGSLTDECEVTVESSAIPVSSVTYKGGRTQLSLELTETYQLVAIVNPDNATNKEVEWRSSDSSVATVDQNGLVKPVSPGVTAIRAIAKDGSGKSASCAVTVMAPEVVHVSSVTLSTDKIIDLVIGKEKVITADVGPDNAADTSLVWSVNDPEAISLEPFDGGVKLTGIKTGNYKVTAAAADGGAKAACTVTVIKEIIPVNGITISQKEAVMYVGSTLQLSASVHPDNATNKSIVWSTSAGAAFTLSPDVPGLLIASGVAGDGWVFAKAGDELEWTAQCHVTVERIKVAGVSLDCTALSMKVGEQAELKPTITPANATRKTVRWETDNKGVVTVTDGRIKAVGEGKATVSVITEDGSFEAVCHVTVTSGTPGGGQSEGAGFENWN